MGLFNKQPAEEKAYWKAFAAALKKPSADTFAALEEAGKAWPNGWEGYFLMGLSYDLAAGVEFHPDKAAEYHYKAKDIGAKVNSAYVNDFYIDYDCPQPNFRATDEYYPRAMNVRKMGTGMLANQSHERNYIWDNDRKFWQKLISHIDTGRLFKSTAEQDQVELQLEPYQDYLGAMDDFDSPSKSAKEALDRRSSDLIKRNKKMNKIKPDSVTLSYVDTWHYVFGLSQLQGGPYSFTNGDLNRSIAFNQFWTGAHMGSAPCLHLLCSFLIDRSSELCEIAWKAGMDMYRLDREEVWHQLLYLLELAGKKGDTSAATLVDKLFDQYKK